MNTTPASDPAKLGATCLIALDSADEILPRLLRRTFAHIAPRSSLQIDDATDTTAEQALSFEIDGHRIGGAVFDSQMPSPDWQIAARNSVFWSEAQQFLSTHKGFIALGARGKPSTLGLARAQAVAVTRLAAALCESMPSQGLYWRNAEVCAAPEKVIRAADQINVGKWPLDLWLGWTHFSNQGDDPRAFGLQTRGAAAFLGYELEVPPAPLNDPKEPLRVLLNAAGYLIDKGDTLKNGQWIEVEGERRVCYHRHEGLDGKPRVARLSLPGADGNPDPADDTAPALNATGAWRHAIP